MCKNNPLDVLKECLEKIVPSQDGRTTINPLEFIVCLVFCYLGDSKTFALEAIRRFIVSLIMIRTQLMAKLVMAFENQ